MEIRENSAMELWEKALKYILDEGKVVGDRNERSSKEVLGLNLVLTSLEDVSNPVGVMSNIKKWIYPKLTEIESIILEKRISSSFSYSYGERIFSFDTINQIDDYVIPLLKKNEFSRRAVVSLWNPLIDSNLESLEVPGLIFLDFKIREGKIYLNAFVRSNDIFVGWPANLYQLFTLCDYISSKIKKPIGVISTFSTSAHIFEENINDIKELLNGRLQ